MARIGATLLLLWAFLVAPALCMGGLLEHPCDCGDGAPCEYEESSQHEDSCAGDPCSVVAVPDEDGNHLDDFTAYAVVVPPAWGNVPVPGSPGLLLRTPPIPPDRPRFAYAPSDRPLRI